MQPEELAVVFDFDGTLTRKETLSRFIWLGLPLRYVIRGCFRALPALLWIVPKHRSLRTGSKEGILYAFLKGISRQELEFLAQKFARERIPDYIIPEMMKELFQRSQTTLGVWIISAALGIYLRPFFAHLPVKGVMACELAFDEKGICTGRLATPNCWGVEKVHRWKTQGISEGRFVVYGDSKGDYRMMDMAWEAHLVKGFE